MKSPVDLLASLRHDNRRLNPGVKGLDRDQVTIVKRFEEEGMGYLTIALPSLGQSFLKGLSSGCFTCPPGFKRIRGGAIPEFLQGMFCKVFDPMTGLLQEEADVGIVKSIYEILFLFKKFPSTAPSEKKLDDEAKDGFMSNDEKCRNLSIPAHVVATLERVSSYVLPSLRDFVSEECTPRHGPGAVAEGLKPNQKWQAVTNDLFDEAFNTSLFSLTDFFSGVYQRMSRRDNSDLSKPPRSSCSTSKLISVPKNSTSRRTITIEPVTKQFLQQSLNVDIRSAIERCPIMSLSLDLSDQSKNAKLALEGSLNGNWATIDLKSASDLISNSLVRTIFRPFPHYLEGMMEARSSYYHVQGRGASAYEMWKYAGMGNATCFPVMSIVICLIGISAILHYDRESVTRASMMRAARRIRVYGDDIVVETRYAHQVCEWLAACGLVVNTQKSYLEGNFKESCGTDAFRGVDITPIYFRPKSLNLASDASSYAHLVQFSNQCWKRGLYHLSTTIASYVEREIGRSLPLVSEKSGGLGWHSRQDACTVERWDRRLHQFLVRADVLQVKKRPDRISGYAALLKFFCTPLIERNVGHLEKTPLRFKSKISRKWVPATAG